MTEPVAIDSWEPGSRPRRIRDCVAAVFGIEAHRLIGRARHRELVRVRHLAMWVVKECCADMSNPMIGRVFGGRDHSTILHGLRANEARFERDPEFAAIGRHLVEAIGHDKGRFVFDAEMRARIEAAVAEFDRAQETIPATPVERPVEEIAPIVRSSSAGKPRNDFSTTLRERADCAAMAKLAAGEDAIRAGSRELAEAITREGVWR